MKRGIKGASKKGKGMVERRNEEIEEGWEVGIRKGQGRRKDENREGRFRIPFSCAYGSWCSTFRMRPSLTARRGRMAPMTWEASNSRAPGTSRATTVSTEPLRPNRIIEYL